MGIQAAARPSARRTHRGRQGQSTVEFLLMLPVILAIFFFVVEMGLYFSAIHYTNYVAFTTARSKQIGYVGSSGSKSATYVAGLMLTGRAFKSNYRVNEGSNGIEIEVKSWKAHFPFLVGLMPDSPFAPTVNLGPDERAYEGRAFTGCADNDMSSNPC